MNYRFKPEVFDEACSLWEHHVFDSARKQAGFVRMQLLVDTPQAMAIGTWRNKSDAEAFMQTGVFKKLMAAIEGYCDGQPTPHIWELRNFSEA